MVVYDYENDSLADVLRRIGLTGTKIGCGIGVCGACSVVYNGEVVRSCTKKMKKVEDFDQVVTIEGIGSAMHLHPLQKAFLKYGGLQCGICIPGLTKVLNTFFTSPPAKMQAPISVNRSDWALMPVVSVSKATNSVSSGS